MFTSIKIISRKFHVSMKILNSNIENRQKQMMQRGLPKIKPINNVKHIIMVASGKGGVGKSTTAVNLATAMKLNSPDKSIGLLDADVFGPSLPLMMNLNDSPLLDDKNMMIPLNNYGIQCMSMGFLIQDNSALIWRGLMVMQALEKLMRGVNWSPVDYLIIDTPPGTGDTHLTLLQNLPIDGVVLVSTPQNAALHVTKRSAIMFNKLNVPIIGLVENMSSVKCSNCSSRVKLFGDGAEQLAYDLNISLLQKIPLDAELTKGSDEGVPICIQVPNSEISLLYKSLSKDVINFIKNNNNNKKTL